MGLAGRVKELKEECAWLSAKECYKGDCAFCEKNRELTDLMGNPWTKHPEFKAPTKED
jgi:hypothetical protein